MRRLIYLCLLLVCLTGASALGGEIHGVVKPAAPGLIIGLFAEDGRHIRDTHLDLATGEFRFKNVLKGTYEVHVSGDGLRLVGQVAHDLEVPVQGVIDLGTIALEPSAWITGTVDPPGEATRLSACGPTDLPWGTVADDKGAFELTGMPPGDYTVTIDKSGYEPCSVKVSVESVTEYKLGHIVLRKTGSISGRIILEGKPPAAYARGVYGRPLLVCARRIGDPKHNNLSNYHEGHIEPSGEYTIGDLGPGHYDITIEAGGVIVMGISGLPADASGTSDTDRIAVEATIGRLTRAFSKGDIETVRRTATDDCRFSLENQTGLEHLGKSEGELAKMGKHTPLILRAGRDEAMAFTRTDLPVEDEVFVQKLGKGIRWDIVEAWELRRIGETWKLAGYGWDPEMSLDINWPRMGLLGMKKDAPSVNLILTDAPALTDFEVKTGEVSTGHDWTLKFP